ncbi:MAG: Mut7-C RNAse domain-containing protein [Syntrophorhabdaceae bacterium]|nr:Mut7-C RNAse domain-containing protein [Syntrophorhabdaceae bacterium]
MIFVCDIMLGRLARYLRILGFNTIHIRSKGELEGFVSNEPHLFFTKRRQGPSLYKNAVYIKSDKGVEQLKEITPIIKPFFNPDLVMSRCILCNRPLTDVEKEEIENLVPEFIYHRYDTFKACPECKRVYWGGTHTERMHTLIKEIGF